MKQPGRFSSAQLRTLQRRVSEWRALHGPEREVCFEQVHVPGREGAFDFTNCNELRVTIQGVLFAHLLFQFVLSFSKWRHVTASSTRNPVPVQAVVPPVVGRRCD